MDSRLHFGSRLVFAPDGNLFIMLAASGLAALFGAQALVNLGSTLALIPTKGMTLPLVSYGGSSLFAISLAMGFALALTRKRIEPEDEA